MCTWCVAQMIPCIVGGPRIEAHNGLIPGGAKYTRGRRPVELVYSESFHNKQDAQRREYAIKQMTKTKKLRLIEGVK